MSAQRISFGAYGERVAERYLCEGGMVVLDHNWRCDLGELDLVLQDGATVVFCEVKTRRGVAHGAPIEAVTAAKAERLRRLGERWLADHAMARVGARIDLVGVLQDGHGAAEVEHVRGVA